MTTRTFSYNLEEDNDLELRQDGELIAAVGHTPYGTRYPDWDVYIAGQHWAACMSPDEADRVADELHLRASLAREFTDAAEDEDKTDRPS